MNIIISSWPKAGGTTRAVILAYILNFRYINVSNIQKYISTNIIDGSDMGQIIFEQRFGQDWDYIWEAYIKWKLDNEKQIVVDGILTGFFAEDPFKLFEVMIIAHQNARLSRTVNPLFLKQVDAIVRDRWMRKYNIDIFSMDQIDLNYDLIIDGSNLNLEEDLITIIEDFVSLHGEKYFKTKDIEDRIEEAVQLFYDEGLDFFLRKIHKNIIHPPEILREWAKKFKGEVSFLPEPFRNFVGRHN